MAVIVFVKFVAVLFGHEFHEAAEPQPKVKSHPTALFGVRQLA